MDSQRVAFIRYSTGEGKWSVGSGLFIGERLVLTADHVVDGDEFKVVFQGKEQKAHLVVRSRSSAVDLAVLEVPGAPTFSRLSYTGVNMEIITLVSGCTAVGFPRFKKDGEGRRRSAHITGIVPTAEGYTVRDEAGLMAEFLTFRITDDTARDVPLPLGEDLTSRTSPWGGMSGAVVFTSDDRVLGVVRHHSLSEGTAALAMTPISAIDNLSKEQVHKFRDVLGITDALPLSPTAALNHDVRAARRVVGARVSASVDMFRDRVTFRSDLHRLVLSREHTIVSVTGRRGIGKSGLVARVLSEFEDEANAEASAVGGIAYLSTRTDVGVIDLARVFHALTRILGGTTHDRLEALWGNKDPDAITELLTATQDRRIVLVLDNLDDLQDPVTGRLQDAGLESFLDLACRVPRPPLIITTSQKPLALPPHLIHHVYGVEINDGLELPDAVTYVRKADLNGAAKLRDAPDDVISHLVEQVHRIPRGLELLVSLRANDPAFELEDDPEATIEEVIENLITEGFEALDDVERGIVQHLALAGAPLPVKALEMILGKEHPSALIKKATKTLVRHRMISGDSSGVRLHPVDSDFFTRSLVEYPDVRARMDLRLADWLATQRTDPHTWRTSTDVGSQRREFRHRVRAGDINGALFVLYDTAEFIAQHGESERIRRMLQYVPENSCCTEGRARFHHVSGIVEFYDGDLSKSIDEFNVARNYALQARQITLHAKANLWYSVALRHAGRAPEAIYPVREAIKAGLERDSYHFALLQLALCQCYIKNFTGAEESLNELRNSLQFSDPSAAWAWLYDADTLFCLMTGDLDGVFLSAEKSITQYANSPQAPLAGYTINVRGLAHCLRGEKEKAVSDFKAVVEGARVIGETRMGGFATLNLAWVYILSGDRHQGLSYADSAVASLSKVGVAEAQSAILLKKAIEQEDDSSMLRYLQDAVTKSIGNPDLCQPSINDLQEAVHQLIG